MGKRRKKVFVKIALAFAFIISGLVILSSFDIRKKDSPATNSNLFYTAIAQQPAKESTLEIISPDEKYTLIMKNVNKSDDTVSQIFTTVKEEDKKRIVIYEKISNPENLIVIPFNSFSPDDKYVFLKIEDRESPKYIVLRVDGENIKGEEKEVEITGLFQKNYPDFVITDVTGWGGYFLIVVNTDTKDGKVGPSWWFDLSNFSFIKLSSRFN